MSIGIATAPPTPAMFTVARHTVDTESECAPLVANRCAATGAPRRARADRLAEVALVGREAVAHDLRRAVDAEAADRHRDLRGLPAARPQPRVETGHASAHRIRAHDRPGQRDRAPHVTDRRRVRKRRWRRRLRLVGRIGKGHALVRVGNDPAVVACTRRRRRANRTPLGAGRLRSRPRCTRCRAHPAGPEPAASRRSARAAGANCDCASIAHRARALVSVSIPTPRRPPSQDARALRARQLHLDRRVCALHIVETPRRVGTEAHDRHDVVLGRGTDVLQHPAVPVDHLAALELLRHAERHDVRETRTARRDAAACGRLR